MARGKQTCKILKEIRRQIAEANDIEFVTSECRYKGDCLGTCPKCEAEVQYLEQQLRKRQLMGKAVVLTGLSAGMIAFSSCGSSSNQASDDSYRLQGEPMEIVDTLDWEEGEIPALWNESEIDEKPQFPGGEEKMRQFFDECYRKEKDIIIGEATIGYVVTSNGIISNPEIVKGDSILGAQLIRIISQFPKYSPGKKNGYPVDVYMTFPFSTSLNVGVDIIK